MFQEQGISKRFGAFSANFGESKRINLLLTLVWMWNHCTSMFWASAIYGIIINRPCCRVIEVRVADRRRWTHKLLKRQTTVSQKLYASLSVRILAPWIHVQIRMNISETNVFVWHLLGRVVTWRRGFVNIFLRVSIACLGNRAAALQLWNSLKCSWQNLFFK